MNFIVFSLADKEYGVDIKAVREVKRIKEVTPIPQSLAFIEGVVSLKGKIVPIINLRIKLGLPAAASTALNRVLITESAGHVFGLAVDSVTGVTSIDDSNIEPPDEILRKAEYLTGVGKAGKRLILIADVEKLLSVEDRTGIAEARGKVEIKKRGS
jgi:purine-binding chemotaxis protein CheW